MHHRPFLCLFRATLILFVEVKFIQGNVENYGLINRIMEEDEYAD